MTAKRKITDKNGVQVYPITHTKAVLDDNGNSVEQRLQENLDLINQKQLEVGAVPSDSTPTVGSTNWVTSGGVKEALDSITGRSANYTEGYLINSAGGTSVNSNYGYTDYIPCTANDTVAFSPGGNISYSGAFFCFYDSNKSLISYYTANALPRTVTAPANSAFVRGSIYLPNKSGSFCDVNGARVWIPLDAIEGMIPDITPLIPNNSFDFFSENPVQNEFLAKQLLGNSINYVTGRFITSAGNISGPGTAYSYALDVNNGNNSYFQCSPGDVIIWHAGGSYSGIYLCFYTVEEVLINYYTNNSQPRQITAPNNAAYFRFSYVTANIATAYCKVNGKIVWKALAASKSILPDVIDDVNSTDIHAALSANQGYMLDKYRSLCVLGNNSTLAGKAFRGLVVGGHSYKIHLLNKDFDVSGDTLTTVHDRLNIKYKKKNSDSSTTVVQVNNNTALSNYYSFTAGENGDIIEYVSIYIRATKDEIVQFLIEDVSYEVNDTSIKTSSFNLNGVSTVQTDAKILEFTNLFQTAGDAIQSFVFFTDPHLFNNVSKFNDYILNIQKYYRNTPTDFILCGGDWLQNNDSVSQAVNRLAKVDAVCRRMLNPFYNMVGNHDTNYLGTEELSATVIANLWFREYGKAYYNFKNTNTRYYVFDTGKDNDHSLSSYRLEQLSWFADSLIQNTDDNHIIMCFHIYYYNSTNIETFAQKIIDVASAYNNRDTITIDDVEKDFTAASGKIHAAIVGHSHADFNAYNNGIPVIGTLNTQKENTPSYDLVLIDYTNDVINMVRVGTGNSRTISLSE